MAEADKHHVAPPFDGWRLCGHCEGYGKCHSGQDEKSCFVCAKAAKVLDAQTVYPGLPCSVCHGHGCSAPFEVKFNRLIGAGMTVFLCVAVFSVVLIAFGHEKEVFDKVLTFAGTIIGSITGFYFGASRARTRAGNA